MIVGIQDVLEQLGEKIPEKVVRRKISAVEQLIRDETNNNFQNRKMRAFMSSEGGVLKGSSQYFRVGDTVEINRSINEGIFNVEETGDGFIRLDKELFATRNNMVTRVVYPDSVKEGVLNMLDWEFRMRSKTGIKSESLSRHSVTYFDMDASNSLDGYPASIVGFLEPYYQMR